MQCFSGVFDRKPTSSGIGIYNAKTNERIADMFNKVIIIELFAAPHDASYQEVKR